MGKNLYQRINSLLKFKWPEAPQLIFNHFQKCNELHMNCCGWKNTGRMHLWFTILLLKDGQWQHPESTRAIWICCTRNTRDWSPGSVLCSLLCSWSYWQLLEEVLCNTGVPLSAGTWDVPALGDTLQDRTRVHRALLCCWARAAGAGGSQALAQGPGKNKTSKNCSQAGKAATFGWCLCLGGFCWQKMCTAFSPSPKRHLSWKQRKLCLHYRSKGTVWDSRLGHVAHPAMPH